MLLRAAGLMHAYGERVTLAGLDLEIHERARIALTGRNGSGKTTLLRVLAGLMRPDAGELTWAHGASFALLAQDSGFPPEATVASVMSAALAGVHGFESATRDLEARLAVGEPVEDDLVAMQARFEAAGGYAAPAWAGRVQAALALRGLDDRLAATLSGGERTRLALAAALVLRPDLLLLDEPTNHLDVAMREWLEEALRAYPGAVLIVSHDRALLDAVAQSTWRLERGRLEVYRGGYSAAKAQRAEDRRVRTRHANLGRRETRRLEGAAGVVAAWGRSNDRLARRAKAISRRAERVRIATPEAPARERRLALVLHAGVHRAQVLLSAEHLSKAYGERQLFSDAALRLRSGDRVALLAPNGAGKTTLLRVLVGLESSDARAGSSPDARAGSSDEGQAVSPGPRVRFTDGVSVAYFDQLNHGLDARRPVFRQLTDRVTDALAKAYLGRFGFRAEDWPKRPDELSGGERARAGLALVSATRADLLFLDEPTNHLDVETVEALEEALQAYAGSLMFVTHDRTFARNVATRVLGLEDGRLVEYERGLDGYLDARRGRPATLDPARRLVDDEPTPQVIAPPVRDPSEIADALEERLGALDTQLLTERLSDRDRGRAMGERDRALRDLRAAYADVYAASLAWTHRVQSFGLSVLADSADGATWRFWLDGLTGQLRGAWEGQALRLDWTAKPSSGVWLARALLAGATSVALEHLNAASVMAPGGATLNADEYVAAVIPRSLPCAPKLGWRFHPSWEDWTRARWRRRRRKAARQALAARGGLPES